MFTLRQSIMPRLVLLGLVSLAYAVDFTTVFEWSDWAIDLNKPPEDTINIQPTKTYPVYMAVHGERVFLSLRSAHSVFVSLVTLSTACASTGHPKLLPFPSMEMHRKGNCSGIICSAKGLAVDTESRLWVLDNGSVDCKAKLVIFDLEKDNEIDTVHVFLNTTVSSGVGKRNLLDIALDETPEGWVAYILDLFSDHIIIFHKKSSQSWSVRKTEEKFTALALSTKEPRQLFLGGHYELYSIPLSELTTAKPKWIARSSARPYRMLIDNASVLYAALFHRDYLSTWNISFSEHPGEVQLYKAGPLGADWPFTFALDANGTLWMTELNTTIDEKPRYKLLKATERARSCLCSTSKCDANEQKMRKVQAANTTLKVLFTIAATAFLACVAIIGSMYVKMNQMNPPMGQEQNYLEMSPLMEQDQTYMEMNHPTTEQNQNYMEMNAVAKPVGNNGVDERHYEEIDQTQPSAPIRINRVTPPPPDLYERPIMTPRASVDFRPGSSPAHEVSMRLGALPPAPDPPNPPDDDQAETDNVYDEVGASRRRQPSDESGQYNEIS